MDMLPTPPQQADIPVEPTIDQLLGPSLYRAPDRTDAFGRGGRAGAYGRGTGPWNRRRPPRTSRRNAPAPSQGSPSDNRHAFGNSGGAQSKQGSPSDNSHASGNSGEDHSKQGSPPDNRHASGSSGGVINPNRGAHQKSSKMMNVLTELRMQQTAPAFLEEVINTAEADKVEANKAGSFLSPGTGQKR